MAVLSNTVTVPSVGSAGGNREDLSDILYNTEPTQTPFLTAAGRPKTASAFLHEWMIESLNAANKDNAGIDGDGGETNSAKTPSSRVGNQAQLFRKVASVSDGQNAVSTAGNAYKMKREKANKMLELKRDREQAYLSNNPSVAANDTTAGKSGGMQAWLTSNVSRGSGGASGGYSAGIVAAATGGTDRAFTETLFGDVLQSRFTNAGMPDGQLLAFMPASVKRIFSAFTGLAANRVNSNPSKDGAKITGAIEIYLSDFGEVLAVPHPYGFTGGEKACLIIDPTYVGVAALKPIYTKVLASTGTADRELIATYETLECNAEKAHAIVTDLL